MWRVFLLAPVALLAAVSTAGDYSSVRALVEHDRFAEARDRLLATAPNDDQAAIHARLLAASFLGLGDLDEARSHSGTAIRLEPDNAEGHLILARCAAAQLERASVVSKIGLAREVRRELETAVRLAPDLVPARLDLLRFHATALSIVGGSVDEAWRQAAALESLDRAAAAFGRGYIAYRTERFTDAERELTKAIRLAPDRRDARIWAGYLFMETQQYARAFSALEPLLESDPDYAPAWFELARTAAYSSTRLDEAEKWLKRYLEVTPLQGWPSHARAWAFLGLVYERDGKPDKAGVAWERALRIDPLVEEAGEGLSRLESQR